MVGQMGPSSGCILGCMVTLVIVGFMFGCALVAGLFYLLS
jgi:hypothetical protein